MNDNVKYWIDLADYDFDVAKAMLETKKYLYVGFMCHQAIEKALKAIIAKSCAEGEIPPKIHNLQKLAEKAELFSKMSETQRKTLHNLNPLNIQARYPDLKNAIAADLTVDICRDFITKTEELLCWIKQQL